MTTSELARRFPISLALHIGVFLLISLTYIRDLKATGYSSGDLVIDIVVLCITFSIFHLFAPLGRGYKARRVIIHIKKKDSARL